MSKVTVITCGERIIAIGLGHLSEDTARRNNIEGMRGGLRPMAGQHLQELEIEGDLKRLQGWAELHDYVRPFVKF